MGNLWHCSVKTCEVIKLSFEEVSGCIRWVQVNGQYRNGWTDQYAVWWAHSFGWKINMLNTSLQIQYWITVLYFSLHLYVFVFTHNILAMLSLTKLLLGFLVISLPTPAIANEWVRWSVASVTSCICLCVLKMENALGYQHQTAVATVD